MYVKLNALRIGLIGQRKHLLKQLLLGHRAAAAVHQRGQHRQFTRRQRQRLALQQEIAFVVIGQRAILQRRLRGADAAAQQRPNARFQLIQFERLGEVIVRPQIQALHPIGHVGARRQQQHRQILPALAQARQQIRAVQTRQRHIQHCQRIAFVEQQMIGRHAVRGDVDGKAGAGQRLLQPVRQLGVIFNQ